MGSLRRGIRRWLPSGSFQHNVAVLAGGTAIGNVVLGASIPVLTRLFSPREFGVYAVYTSLLALGLVVACLRYEVAITLPREPTDAANLLALSFGVTSVVTVLLGVAMWVLREPIARWTGSRTFAMAYWLLPLAVFGGGVFQALSLWSVRAKQFSTVSGTRIVQRVGQVTTQFSLGRAGATSLGLPLGDAVGRIAGAVYLSARMLKRDSHLFQFSSVRSIRQAAWRYRRFPMLATGAGLASMATTQLPFLLLAGLYGRQVTGFYAVAESLVSLPVVVVAAAVSQVYIAEAAALVRADDIHGLRRLFRKTASNMLVAGALPAAVLLVFAPVAFSTVLGSGWTEAGGYAQVMTAMYFGQFAILPLAQSLIIVERQDLQLLWDSLTLSATVAVLVVAKSFDWSGLRAVFVYSIAMGVLAAGYFLFVHAFLGRLETTINGSSVGVQKDQADNVGQRLLTRGS